MDSFEQKNTVVTYKVAENNFRICSHAMVGVLLVERPMRVQQRLVLYSILLRDVVKEDIVRLDVSVQDYWPVLGVHWHRRIAMISGSDSMMQILKCARETMDNMPGKCLRYIF